MASLHHIVERYPLDDTGNAVTASSTQAESDAPVLQQHPRTLPLPACRRGPCPRAHRASTQMNTHRRSRIKAAREGGGRQGNAPSIFPREGGVDHAACACVRGHRSKPPGPERQQQDGAAVRTHNAAALSATKNVQSSRRQGDRRGRDVIYGVFGVVCSAPVRCPQCEARKVRVAATNPTGELRAASPFP